MRFGRWYPLAEAATCAPHAPGVFQVRIAGGLLDYPRGKSAMVSYQAADDVAAAAAALAAGPQAHRAGGELLCRHAEELSERERADPDAAVATLVEQFRRRFGAPPSFPEELTQR